MCVCMYVCMYVYMYVCMYVYMCVCVCVRACLGANPILISVKSDSFPTTLLAQYMYLFVCLFVCLFNYTLNMFYQRLYWWRNYVEIFVFFVFERLWCCLFGVVVYFV